MGQVITLFSPKGGVGRTFLTTNLAVSISGQLAGKKILLIDMDFDLPGDMSKLLNFHPTKAIVDIITLWEKNNYSPVLIKDYIHNFSDTLDFLPVILKVSERTILKGEFLQKIIEDLKTDYEFIIIDAGRNFSKLLISIFEYTNLILLVVNPDLLSVHKIKETVEKLQYFSFPLRMIKLILNRSESLGGVTWQEVKLAIPAEIVAHIPSQGKIVCSSLNRQIPLVFENPRCQISIFLNKLAQLLISNPSYFTPLHDLEGKICLPISENYIDEEDSLLIDDLNTSELRHVDKNEELKNALKKRVHKRLIREVDLRRLDIVASSDEQLKKLHTKTKIAINNALADETGSLIGTREKRENLIKEILDEAFGLGPLEDLLNNDDITDIMVNNKDCIYAEINGQLQLTAKSFSTNEQVRQVIERIIAPLGRRIDESNPMVDARLADGSRINAIIPPLSLTGPTLTIRKFGKTRLITEDLLKFNALNLTMSEFLKACVLTRKNIIVSGGTGSGKTTVLNILSEYISSGERLVTIEDAAELKLKHEHCVRLESRPSNIEGKGLISVRDLFKNSLRMRPDRIIIGECRGPETLDMLQAMNTGHNGSMTTIHANSTHDVLSRLDSLILMSGIEIPLRAIREMIASAIDLIVHTVRLSDGSRKITQITEITGMTDEIHIGMKDIYKFNQTGLDENKKVLGYFTATEAIPSFFDTMKQQGVAFTKDIFTKSDE